MLQKLTFPRRILLALLCCFFPLSASAVGATAAMPRLTFYAPFNGSTTAKIAGGNATPHLGKAGPATFTSGIVGQGYLTGQQGQQLRYAAKGNISPNQWTISFWVKGLKGANWYGKSGFQDFWGLNGEQGEILWFYHYNNRQAPWLFYRPKKAKQSTQWLFVPHVDVRKWHNWVVTWHKGSKAYLYLDGRLVGQTPGVSPQPVRWITIGGSHLNKPNNKIIDEFKIYDGALTPEQVARQYYREGGNITTPVLTVSPTSNALNIDGNITSAQWQNAASFTGFIDTSTLTTAQPATWGKITYDNHYLYLALHSPTPEQVIHQPDKMALHGLVKKDAVKPDGNVSNDDHFALTIEPANTNKRYVIDINALGTVYDAKAIQTDAQNTRSVAKMSSAWNSHIRLKSMIDMHKGWSIEAAIPLKAFGINHIAPGSTWKINFARVWKMLKQTTDSWATVQSPDNMPLGLGYVHFIPASKPFADLKQFQISSNGDITADLTLINGNTQSHKLTTTLKAGPKTLTTKTITLKPGKQDNALLKTIAENSAGKLITLIVKSDNTVILKQAAPLIPKQVGQLALWKYPSQRRIRIGWTLQSAANINNIVVSTTIKNKQGKTILTGQKTHLTSVTGSLLINTKSLPSGSYTVTTNIRSGKQIVQQKQFIYNKKPLPKWVGNKLGISTTPPAPWTDVKVNKNNDEVSIWGRTYQYDHHLLPVQIANQGKDMLAAPMQLTIQNSSNKISSTLKIHSIKWTQTTPKRGASTRSQTLGQVRVQINSYTDFDGMTWMKLKIAPAGKPAHIRNLTLNVPLKSSWAQLIKPYFDYRLKNTGVLTKGKWEGKAFKTMPWIGNSNGGIQFFMQSVANWIGSKTITISPANATNKKERIVKLHLIDKPTIITKPVEIALGWIVSPVKKSRVNLRNYRFVNGGPLANGKKSTAGNYLIQAKKLNRTLQVYLPWMQNWSWRPPHAKKVRNPAPMPVPATNLKDVVIDYHGINIYPAPYGRMTQIGTANPWFKQFGDEWTATTSKFYPNTTAPLAKRIANVSQSSRSLRDLFAWGYYQLFNKFHARAAYFDVSRPMRDSNVYHGSGTKMPDGSIQPTLNILATRKTFERVYTELKAKYPNGIIFYHTSGEIMLPIDSFCDMIVDGENYTGLLNRKNNRGYEHVLSLSQFRTEYSAQNNFGPSTLFLPEFGRSGSIKPDEWQKLGYQHARYLLGLVLLHDSSIWWTYFPRNVLADAYLALDKTGWDATWKFIPYWQQNKFTSLPQKVVASIYYSPDKSKAILIIMNVSKQTEQVSLPLGTYTNATMLYPSRTIQTNNHSAQFNIGAKDFRAILLK